MNVCKMEEWGLVHRIAPIQQDHFNAAASKVILCPDPTVLVRNTTGILNIYACSFTNNCVLHILINMQYSLNSIVTHLI